jgi:hypothetical protein
MSWRGIRGRVRAMPVRFSFSPGKPEKSRKSDAPAPTVELSLRTPRSLKHAPAYRGWIPLSGCPIAAVVLGNRSLRLSSRLSLLRHSGRIGPLRSISRSIGRRSASSAGTWLFQMLRAGACLRTVVLAGSRLRLTVPRPIVPHMSGRWLGPGSTESWTGAARTTCANRAIAGLIPCPSRSQ